MLTVTNLLKTHLVIPEGLTTGKSLVLRPKGTKNGTINVDGSTPTLDAAVKAGLVTVEPKSKKKKSPPISAVPAPLAVESHPEVPVSPIVEPAPPIVEPTVEPIVADEPDEADEAETVKRIKACLESGMSQAATGKKLGLTRAKVYSHLRRERKRIAAEENN